MGLRTPALLVAAALLVSAAAAGQTPAPAPQLFAGPPAPVPPEVVSRDAADRVTIRAVRLDAPLRIDGVLDEAHYRTVQPISGFVQIEPEAGQPAGDRTDVWLAFDRDAVYVSVRCWDRRPESIVGTEMRRDSQLISQGNDHVIFLFDTFYDRRNAVTFMINPIGGRSDGQITNERQYSGDWNPVWEGKTARFDGGWTVEARVPFKSLRFRPGGPQVWSFNVMRVKRATNEISLLKRMPRARGQATFQNISLAPTVVGIEVPSGGSNLDVKPYATSSLRTDATASPAVANDLGGDLGVDVKYGITQSLTGDFTYNTDFAQVEADEQQVNLTRFSLFLPEKREFFLENQGLFSFGGVALGGRSVNPGDTPILFYSRRIGLNQGREVPVDVGGRLTGRAGKYSVGIIDIRTGEDTAEGVNATNFSVVRVKRDLLRRSAVGLLFTGRSVGQAGAGTNEAFGVDGGFTFFDNLVLNTYWARTRTDGLQGKDTSYRAQLDYSGDRYGFQVDRLSVGDHFNPQVGYVRRDDMQRSFGLLRFSPRPRSSPRIRKYSLTGSVLHIENGDGRLETRERAAEFAIDFQNGDRFAVVPTNTFEFLLKPFEIVPGITLPVGGYTFNNIAVSFNMSQQRPLAADLLAEYGTFYSGRRTAFSASRGRVMVSHQLSLEPTYSINRVNLAEGSFTTHLAGSRITFAATPMMFASALVQYNSGTNAVSTNVRFRWEYQPGSELFVVYNEERDTRTPHFPGLSTRAFIVKITRLFRF